MALHAACCIMGQSLRLSYIVDYSIECSSCQLAVADTNVRNVPQGGSMSSDALRMLMSEFSDRCLRHGTKGGGALHGCWLTHTRSSKSCQQRCQCRKLNCVCWGLQCNTVAVSTTCCLHKTQLICMS